jgi:hypothetical protein
MNEPEKLILPHTKSFTSVSKCNKPVKLTESVVEDAALDWLGGLGYEVLSGLAIAPGEPAAERTNYRQVFLFDRLQTKLLSGELRVPSPRLRPADLPAANKIMEA